MSKTSEYFVYILRCEDNSLYTGITTDVERRFQEHAEKGEKGAKYTRTRDVKCIEAVWRCANRPQASKLEYRIKKLDKKKKQTLIDENDFSVFPKETIDPDQYERVEA
ncbi:MAG: GIY-YIG nuclease family protein [Eubacterium sp.]|nr:GIY-YIG nuclease family protein [Eubacterium sp.]